MNEASQVLDSEEYRAMLDGLKSHPIKIMNVNHIAAFKLYLRGSEDGETRHQVLRVMLLLTFGTKPWQIKHRYVDSSLLEKQGPLEQRIVAAFLAAISFDTSWFDETQAPSERSSSRSNDSGKDTTPIKYGGNKSSKTLNKKEIDDNCEVDRGELFTKMLREFEYVTTHAIPGKRFLLDDEQINCESFQMFSE